LVFMISLQFFAPPTEELVPDCSHRADFYEPLLTIQIDIGRPNVSMSIKGKQKLCRSASSSLRRHCGS
jgi:hypothetical protein